MENLENKLGKNELKLSLVIEKDKPIDIQILSSSLIALNDLIDDYVAKDLGTDATSIKLKSVREGSDILDMIICLPFALFALSDFISSINGFFEFFKNIKSIAKKPVEDIKNNKFLTVQNLTKMQHLLDLADEKANARYNINYNNCNVFNLSASTKAEYQDGLNIAKQIKGHEEKKTSFSKMFL